jgi:hypothetical protein
MLSIFLNGPVIGGRMGLPEKGEEGKTAGTEFVENQSVDRNLEWIFMNGNVIE